MLVVLGGCPRVDLEAQCRDGRLNGPEVDVDCGGPCGPCAQGLLCLGDGDCVTGVCTLNRCAAPSCMDGVRNQDEAGVDCGGACAACGEGACSDQTQQCGGPCPKCPPGGVCLINADCAAGLVCRDGACQPRCAPPLLECGATCVDPRVDRQNCGGCNQPCLNGDACVMGQCRPVCAGGLAPCGMVCVDTASDPLNCGQCGMPCMPGEICVGGGCFPSCPPSQVSCMGACVSIDRDPFNCGGCGQPCAPGSGCVGGQCVAGCSAPLLVCGGGACVDPRFDPLNCGGCGMPCPQQQNAFSACTPMGCTRGPCQPGFADCDGMPNGCEAELQVDSNNCGMCGRACFGSETCVFGRCCGPLPMGSYQASCSGCEACNGVLTCLCDDAMQNPQPASIPLGSCGSNITNCNGVLLCNGC